MQLFHAEGAVTYRHKISELFYFTQSRKASKGIMC